MNRRGFVGRAAVMLGAVTGLPVMSKALAIKALEPVLPDQHHSYTRIESNFTIRDLEAGPTLAKVRTEGIDSLSRGEQGRVRLVYLELWGIYEAAYFANERGVLGLDEWARFEFSICNQLDGIVSNFWDFDYENLPTFRQIMTPSFVE